MRTAVLLAAAAVALARLNGPALNDNLISYVNGLKGATWKAGRNSKFEGMSIADAKRFMGTIRDPARVAEVKKGMSADPWMGLVDETALPTNFDVRTAFPWASNITSVIRDQSACGSCWAHGSTEALNDRLAIAKNLTVLLSTFDTMSCCSGFSQGCDGGYPDEAWQWFTSTGVVTGGNYGDLSSQTCANYPFPQCSHHVTSKYPACPSSDYATPSCFSACPNAGYPVSYSADKHFGKTAYNLNSVSTAQQDILTYGSISATFDVYEDFLTYKSGVYQYTTGQLLGGHAVKIIGWGVESGTPYWLVVNSWNQYWGDNGTFKILRGQDECGIEDDLGAGQV